ncbi:MAG: LLM class F420-dependent oxidoreductase [Anaerolineae bacterium]|nr:LLM class F420-dependent oxidoreductase [Anaerolineae bacterium]
MKLGVVFPQTEIGAEAAAVRHYATTAEELGFDYLLAFEHVVGANPDRPGPWQRGPYDYESMFHEPMVLFGYLAAITTRIELATGILILPQRQTVLVAKQAAEIDVLSGGRLRLGVGVGWNSVEYEALGQDFQTRGKRQAEQVALLRKLWTERLVDFSGGFDHVPDAGIHPLPIQRPIPIWFGGGADATLRRMARLGDGWMPNLSQPLDQLPARLEALRGYIRAAGRDPAAFGVDVRIDMDRTSEEDWPMMLVRLADLGVTHVCINTMGNGLDLDGHLDVVARFHDVAASI